NAFALLPVRLLLALLLVSTRVCAALSLERTRQRLRAAKWNMARRERGREAHSPGQRKRGGQLRGKLGHYAVGREGQFGSPGAATVVLRYYTVNRSRDISSPNRTREATDR